MKISHHSESDYIPYVIAFLERNHFASFRQLRSFLADNFPLNAADKQRLPSLGCPRWHQIVRNLKSNKTLMSMFYDVKEVRNGFRTI